MNRITKLLGIVFGCLLQFPSLNRFTHILYLSIYIYTLVGCVVHCRYVILFSVAIWNSGCFNICECESELYSIACSFLLYSIFLFSMFRSDFFLPPFFARFGSCSDCNWMCEIFFQHSTFTMSHIHSLPVQTKDLRLYVSFFFSLSTSFGTVWCVFFSSCFVVCYCWWKKY